MADSTGFGLRDIEYLVNGEYASGSDSMSSSTGVLNRPLAQIDANVRLLANVLSYQHNKDGSLKDSSVVEGMLGDGAVTTSKLASSSVSSAKIASNAVTEGKLASGAVTPAKTNFNSTLAMTSIDFSNTTSSTGNGGYIDFHHNGSTEDYTSRIIESASGRLDITAQNGLYLNGKELGSGGNLSGLTNDLTVSNINWGSEPYFVFGYDIGSVLRLGYVYKSEIFSVTGVSGNLGDVRVKVSRVTGLAIGGVLIFNRADVVSITGRNMRVTFSSLESISNYFVLRYSSGYDSYKTYTLDAKSISSNGNDVFSAVFEFALPSDFYLDPSGQTDFYLHFFCNSVSLSGCVTRVELL